MHINITFFIQIINFLIAYKVLSALVFKPVIASLKAKEKNLQAIHKKIAKQKQELKSLEHEKTQRLHDFQDHIERAYPFKPDVTIEKPIEATIKEPQIDEQKVTTDLVNLLVKKAPDAY